MANLIALYSSGPSCGKTEVARLLAEQHGFTVVKLAKTLKSMVTVMLHDLGIPLGELHRYIEGDLKEVVIPQLGVSPRYLFQTLGTEWGRQLVHKKVWTTIAVARCKAELDRGRDVVVDDMRFPNEFEALHEEAGGTMVRITRPGIVVVSGGHPSEGLLDDTKFDYELVNDGTLEELRWNTALLLQDLRL